MAVHSRTTASKMMSHLNSRAGELKSQGVAEAAQDPESNVSAQDAENVMTAESKKAGVAAFQFDPDASPEEKAAQARSVKHSPRSDQGIADGFDPNSMFPLAFTTIRSPRP